MIEPDHPQLSISQQCNRLCCTNPMRDSLFESRVVADSHEQLVPYKVQDEELAFV